jgi:hypothetical protein
MNPDRQFAQMQARQDQAAINERRRIKHLPVAQALRNPNLAPGIITAARRQIELWRSQHLCSQDYITAWEALLAEPLLAAKLLEEHSLYAIQMRQNSPFVATIRQFQAVSDAA